MAKCLVGAAGGGKVTVSGLSAAVIKQGATVTVKRGARTVVSVTGTLESVVGYFSMAQGHGDAFSWQTMRTQGVTGAVATKYATNGSVGSTITLNGVFTKSMKVKVRFYQEQKAGSVTLKIGSTTVTDGDVISVTPSTPITSAWSLGNKYLSIGMGVFIEVNA